VGKRLGEAGVFERVNIVSDSLEEDVLEIGVVDFNNELDIALYNDNRALM
jgi:hypothetical protein